MNKTGLVWHELYMWHDTGSYAGLMTPSLTVQPNIHYESPEPKRRIKNLLDATSLTDQLTPIKPISASKTHLSRVHTEEYLNKIEAMHGIGGNADDETVLGKTSVDIAKLSAGGAIAAVEAVVAGRVQNAYALIRPPGHHAEKNLGCGFCVYSNAAVAGAHALDELGLQRIAFVDWDVHHGNGTEDIFLNDARALTISLHQDGLFPANRGEVAVCGEGEGAGYNINIPLQPGSGEGAYLYAFEQIVLPALKAFKPELIIVPCGFDASIEDPLGRMMLHAGSYQKMTQALMQVADQLCSGRLVFTHEGGYNPNTTPFLGVSVISTLMGVDNPAIDPVLEAFETTPGQSLQTYQKQWIDDLTAFIKQVPNSLLG